MHTASPSLSARRVAAGADRAARFLFLAIAFVSVLLLLGIFLFLFTNAMGMVSHIGLGPFLFGTFWNPTAYGEPQWGILPLLTGTLFVSIGAMIIAVPFGLSLAIYLSELASRRKREILKPAVEMIAGIPSVVLGLLGLLFLAPLVSGVFGISNGLNAFTAALLVAIAAVPTIASLAEDALRAIPQSVREAGLALGASHWTVIWKTLVPAARTGIGAAIMLGLGRAIGETVVVLMVAGNSLAFPTSMLSPVRPLTATIAIEIRETATGSVHWEALFAIGLLLFILTFLINALSDFLLHHPHR